jgi:hypothetical protein
MKPARRTNWVATRLLTVVITACGGGAISGAVPATDSSALPVQFNLTIKDRTVEIGEVRDRDSDPRSRRPSGEAPQAPELADFHPYVLKDVTGTVTNAGEYPIVLLYSGTRGLLEATAQTAAPGAESQGAKPVFRCAQGMRTVMPWLGAFRRLEIAPGSKATLESTIFLEWNRLLYYSLGSSDSLFGGRPGFPVLLTTKKPTGEERYLLLFGTAANSNEGKLLTTHSLAFDSLMAWEPPVPQGRYSAMDHLRPFWLNLLGWCQDDRAIEVMFKAGEGNLTHLVGIHFSGPQRSSPRSGPEIVESPEQMLARWRKELQLHMADLAAAGWKRANGQWHVGSLPKIAAKGEATPAQVTGARVTEILRSDGKQGWSYFYFSVKIALRPGIDLDLSQVRVLTPELPSSSPPNPRVLHYLVAVDYEAGAIAVLGQTRPGILKEVHFTLLAPQGACGVDQATVYGYAGEDGVTYQPVSSEFVVPVELKGAPPSAGPTPRKPADDTPKKPPAHRGFR